MRIALLLPLLIVPILASAQAPILDVTPGRMSFIAVAGSRTPVRQDLRIRTQAGESITWRAEPSAPWIDVAPASGPVPGSATVSIDATQLAAGSHTARVTVFAAGARGVVPVIVDVAVQIAARRVADPAPAAAPGTAPPPADAAQRPGAGRIGAASGPRLDLFAPEGSTEPVESTVRLDSPRSGPTEWFARSDKPWLTVEPATGMTPVQITVRANPAGLPAGLHAALLRFVDDARDPMLEVPITFTIDPGAAAAPPPAVPARAVQPDAETANEAPAAPAPLALRVDMLPPATRNLPYAQVIPITGGRPPYTVRVVTGRVPRGLTMANGAITGVTRFPGMYPLGLVVTDSSTPPQSIEKTVTLAVIVAYQNTALSVSHTRVNLVARAGQQSQRFGIGVASGSFPLAWTVSSDMPWLLVSPPQGRAPSVFQVGVDAAALEPGIHAATLTVTMEGAANSPMRIPVQVTVRR